MNTNNRKWVILTAVATLVLVGAAILYAQAQYGHRHGMGHGMKRGFLAYVAGYLQLTDAQIAQIKTMWAAEKPTVAPLLQQLAEGHRQMQAVTANGAFDEARVNTIASQQSQTLARLMVEKEKLQSQIYKQVLTPEQRVRADELRQRHSARIDRWLQHFQATPAQ